MEPLSDRQECLLCNTVYFDPPPGCHLLGDIARETLNGRSACGDPTGCSRLLWEALMRDERLCDFRLIAWANKNATSGFVACAYAECLCGAVLILRGSETRGACAPTNIDWLDNFTAPFYGSVQYEACRRFADRFPTGALTLVGHSKGGHNALYACATAKNPNARAVAFNAQGFGPGFLNDQQNARLQQNAVNLVVAGDAVGSLLAHPEKRVFVRYAGTGPRHALCAYSFDASGAAVPARRPILSRALETLSRLAAERPRADLSPAKPYREGSF